MLEFLNFLCFSVLEQMKGKTRLKKYTKQENNKVKWKDVWNSPSWSFQVPGNGARKELLLGDLVVREVFCKSPATAPEKKLDDVDHTFAGEPQEEGMV